jgi:hypothetical protein
MGSVNDRRFYVEYKDKGIRLKGASPIEPQGTVAVFEDFLVDVLADSPFVTVTQSGTATTAAAISATAGDPVAGHGGWVAGGTDDVDAEIDEVSIGGLGTGAGTPWMRADRARTGFLVCEWRITVPTALTTRQYFAGLTDDPVEGTATNGSLNIQTAYTLVDVANDAAGWVFSSLATAPTVWKFASTDGGTGSTVSATTEGDTQVADTETRLRVEVNSAGDCFFYQGHNSLDLTYRGTTDAGISPDVLLVPIFTAAPTTTTLVPWEIDYCYASCAR